MPDPLHAPSPRPQLWDQLGIAGHSSWEDESGIWRDVLDTVRPRSILETGFFAGASAFMFLALSEATVTSVDPMCGSNGRPHEGMLQNTDSLKNHFGDRFTFIRKDSRLVRPDLAGRQFDLMFIDGDHSYDGVKNDFQLAIELGIPWLLVDDFITEVARCYQTEFSRAFHIVRIYPRKHTYCGAPIPIALLKRSTP